MRRKQAAQLIRQSEKGKSSVSVGISMHLPLGMA
jgi:hypothetical protein